MSLTVNDKDLGLVTAYAYAVEGGYTGTEAEFEELLGNIAIDLSEIENLTALASTLPAGSSATALYSDGVLYLGIPKGDKGDAATIAVGTTTTLAAGSSATVSNSGTSAAAVFNFGIPQGTKGDTGSSGVYIGTSAPSDPAINVWVDPTNAYTINAGEVAYSTSATYPSGTVGEGLNDLKSEIQNTGGLSGGVKEALLACFAHTAWVNADGQDYYDALYAALYPPASLSSISAVYTQSGPVYTSSSLDSLKTDLVVTATYVDTSTQTITSYTLSGTLTEGTSTITVSYGGKTTTFNVTVTVYTTAPRIAYTDKAIKNDGTLKDLIGACITEKYTYTMPVASAKQTQYYDETNDYFTYDGVLFKLVYNATNPDSIAFSGSNNAAFFDKNDTRIEQATITFDGTDRNLRDGRHITEFANLEDSKLSFVFTLTTAGLADSYAYWVKSSQVSLLPDGVNEGDIIFAGSNTPYYNKYNINDP